MKVIYISSPYSNGDTLQNVQTQIKAAHRIMDLSHCPIAPNLTYYMDVYKKRPYEDWMKIDLALVSKCDALLRLEGKSPGADREVALAISLGIPVLYGWEDLEDWLSD